MRPPLAYRPDIDGLRAIAILTVVLLTTLVLGKLFLLALDGEQQGLATSTRDTSPPLLEFRITHYDPTQAAKCLAFQRMAFEEIRRLRKADGLRGVVLSASWRLYADGPMEASLRATSTRSTDGVSGC